MTTNFNILLESKSDYISQQKAICRKICDTLYKQDKMDWDKPKTDEEAKEQAKIFLDDLESHKFISKYLVWVVKQFTENNWIYPEDVSRIENDLNKFYRSLDLIKKEGKETDINKYDMASFNKLILDLPETARQEDIQIKDNEAEKVYEDDDFIIIHPLTQEAAILYGKGTKWCTAATEGLNYFNRYNKQGPLYILISKKDPSEKYQFHFESGSFMDKLDKKISIINFIRKYPKIRKYFTSNIDKNNYKNWAWYNIDEIDYNMCLEAVKNNGSALQYVPENLIDYNLCLAAVKNNFHAFEYVPRNLIDYNMYLEAVKNDGYALVYVPENLIDYNLCLTAVKEDGYVLDFVPEKFKDYNMCLEAVKNKGYALIYVPDKFIRKIKKELNINESKTYLSTILESISNNSSSFKLPSNANPNNYKITNNMNEADKWKAKILIGNSMEEGKKVGDWDDVGYIMISLKDNTIIPIARSDEHQRGYELLGDIYELYYKDYYALWVYGKNYPYDLEDLHKLETALLKAKSYGLVFEDNNPIINFYYVKWKEEKYQDYPENIPAKYYFTNYYGKEKPEAKITDLGKELIDAFEKLSFAFIIKKLPDIKIAINNLYKVGNKIKFNNYPFISAIEKEEMLETLDFEDNFEKLQEIFFGFNGWRNKFHQRLRRNKYNKELNEQLGNVEEVIQLMSSI